METSTTTKASVPTERNKAVRVIAGLALVAIIFALSSWLTELTVPALDGILHPESFAQKNAVTKSFMLLFTLAAMWAVYKRLGLRFGFTRGEHLNYGRFTKHAILLGLAGFLFLIAINVLSFVLTKKPPVGFPADSLLSCFLFIWLWSSIVEELLFRGLFQSLIGDLNRTVFRFRKANISMAVLLSGLAFASLHLSLLLLGMSGLFVAGIFLYTLLLGLLAGYLREKTGSLYPAIYVHIVFNVVGSMPVIIQTLVQG